MTYAIVDAEFECHVLAPNRMSRSRKARSMKTDERDAEMIRYVCRAPGRRGRSRCFGHDSYPGRYTLPVF